MCSVAVAALLSLPTSAVAAPPPNDNFADATEMTGWPAEATGSNVDATLEPDEPNHGDHSIWFKWTAPTDVGITVSIGGCAQPFQDAFPGSLTLAVYTKSPVFGLVAIQQPFYARAGQSYWIVIASAVGQPGDPDICVRLLPGPANDDFARATPLSGFPVGATRTRQNTDGAATREPGEPRHGGSNSFDPSSSGSVWYSWTAPADGPVMLRLCGEFGLLAVYAGDRVDALTHVTTRRGRDRRCGSLYGASVRLSATEGEVFRIAVTSPGRFQLLLGNQVAVVAGESTPSFLYTAFPGQTDDVKLRLTGSGLGRALLLEARGVAAANGCHAESAPGLLRCSVPGKAAISLDIDLGDGNDTADIRVPGRVKPSEDQPPIRRVVGGDGNDTLAGSAGSYGVTYGWTGGLTLSGGPGADRFTGGPGDDLILGGPGPDQIDPGAGTDSIGGGPGNDRVRTLDGASDSIRCQAGRDRARLDGMDISQGCEHRKVSGSARAVATDAYVTDNDTQSHDHLVIFIACPIDARRGCRSRITPAVPGERTISRRLKLAAGRSGQVRFFSFDMDRLVRRGVRVTVSTQRRGRGTLKFTRHLPALDDRYEGE